MMTEHFESWYATLDTSLRNMVEGGLVATACGWAGATVFTLLAAAAWVRGRIRAARAVVTAKEAALTKYAAQGSTTPVPVEHDPTPVVKEPTLTDRVLEALRAGEPKPVVGHEGSPGFMVGPLRVTCCGGNTYLDAMSGGHWFGMYCSETAARWSEIRDAAIRAADRATVAILRDAIEGEPAVEPEPKPEPCSPPLSPLASVLLELFACAGVLPTDKGFKVGALSVVSLRPFRLIYPVDGTPTDMIPLLGEADAEAVRKAAMGAWGRHSDAADDKARERAVAALKAQVAVFRGKQAKPQDPFLKDLARLREQFEMLAKTCSV
jgi:hypothetical protein